VSDLEPAPEPRRRTPRTALVVSLAMAVLVAPLVAVLATRAPSTERAVDSPLIGRVAPTTEGSTIDGGFASIADHRGKWVVLNFFAQWCVPCQEEHPELLAFDAAHRAEGDAVLIGTTFDDTAEKARDFFEENGGDWPVLDDPESRNGVAYGVAQVPETFVISPDGVVRARFAGKVTREALDAVIERGSGDDQ
jgi:cytochrome c biogenesis protein CcmG/thiol:disulfide interchange protein DsbE